MVTAAGSVLLRGMTYLSLDDKGRMPVPAKMRPLLQDHCAGQMVTTIEVSDSCLLIYPRPEWEVVQAKLMSLPSLDPKVKRLQRLIMGQACDLQLDSAGRLLLPAPLRDYAQLERRAVLMGLGNKFELWSEPVWQQRQQQYRDDQELLDLSNDFKDLSL